MYVLEYLIYHLRPYGINSRFVAADGTELDRKSLDETALVAAAWKSAASDMGKDDVFRKSLNGSLLPESERSNDVNDDVVGAAKGKPVAQVRELPVGSSN